MRNLVKGILLIIFGVALLTTGLYAQNTEIKRSNNKVTLDGKTYYIHIVRKGETLFAISSVYNVPVDTIKKDNLQLTSDLKVNQYVKIRAIDPKKDNEPQFVYHQVIKGDTPFNIARRYNVTIKEIYENNSGTELGIKLGQNLKIPLHNESHEEPVAENPSVEPVKEVQQDGYILHKVDKKETKYGIANNYKVTIAEIEAINPGLSERMLNVGELIKIPASKEKLIKPDDTQYHKVAKQETIFGITKIYQTTEKELLKLNPELKKRGLQEGELILVPQKTDSEPVVVQKVEVKDTLKTDKPFDKKFDTFFTLPCPDPGIDTVHTYKVAFFLPLFLNLNDTLGKFIDKVSYDADGNAVVETVPRDGKSKEKIYKRTELFLDFYEGALLALNDLKKEGMSFEVHIFDTQNDSLHTVKLLKENALADFNLFIGPFYSDILNIVSNYAREHQINIVSPLSMKNSFIEHNPYAFQVSPPFEVQMLHASEYLNDFDTKNYIVIHDGKDINQDYTAAFKKELYAQMNESNYDQFKYNEVFYYDARDSVLKDVFTPGIENIVIIPSSDQAFVSDVIGKLNGYSYKYDITTFGQPRWLSFDNIELESFHNTKTHIFSNSFIDYSKPNVIQFVKDYRTYFKTEPEKYAFQGYDITRYFCSALNKYGHEFRKCIHMHNPELLQTKYNFVPYTDQGGYQNAAIYILGFTKDNKLVKTAEYPKTE